MNTPKQTLRPWKLKHDLITNRYVLKYKYPVRDKVLSVADALSEHKGIEVDEVKFHLERTADLYIHTRMKQTLLTQIIEELISPKKP